MHIHRRIAAALLTAAVLVHCAPLVLAAGDLPLKDKIEGLAPGEEIQDSAYPSYEEIRSQYPSLPYDSQALCTADLDALTLKKEDGTAVPAQRETLDDAQGVRHASGRAEYAFSVGREGLYLLRLTYWMPEGSSLSAKRNLLVDGEVPFAEAESIAVNRLWKDKSAPAVNSAGDETYPSQEQIFTWQQTDLRDAAGAYSEPLVLHLQSGSHVIALEYVAEAMILGQLQLVPYRLPISYEEYRGSREGSAYAGETLQVEAEEAVTDKNDPTVRMEADNDPICSPPSVSARKLNAMGGWRWRRGTQTITFRLQVPEDGWYKLALRCSQIWNDGLPSYRRIEIDGQLPFAEMTEVRFDYSRRWNTTVLADEEGEPYLFWLEAGEREITMTVVLGEIAGIARSLNEDILRLSAMIRQINAITGSSPDPHYDYELFSTIPTLRGDMEALAASLREKEETVRRLAQKTPAMAGNFQSIASQLDSMIHNPFSIAGRIGELNNALTTLGTWYNDVQVQPLMIDYFLLGSPDAAWGNPQSSIWQKIWATLWNFLISFQKDYDSIGGVAGDVEITDTLDIWVARGTEWAELIKQLSDEQFTPKTGIQVNLNVLPAGQLSSGSVNALMLAISSGNAPDAALGVEPGSPVEFAIRGAVHDLSSFPDFEETAERFLPSIFIPFEYNGGVYALPENMDFMVMIYRKDIIAELGIRLPDTRQDLYDHVLPVLNQNKMQFYYPADFTQFLFQNGAAYYREDGAYSGLDSAEAYQGFKECAELFINYGVPVSANFFSRFRTGEMPMGLGKYADYQLLSVGAPELMGRWGIAPLPGTRTADGQVDRSHGGIAGQCAVIMSNSEKKEQAWQFLRWWTETDVQLQFANEIEAMIGVEARWNTANLEAFDAIPWGDADLAVFHEQWKWAKEVPIVPGGYFTSRHLTNAWNRIVINGQPVRMALEEAVADINRELLMQREEYGLTGGKENG